MIQYFCLSAAASMVLLLPQHNQRTLPFVLNSPPRTPGTLKNMLQDKLK